LGRYDLPAEVTFIKFIPKKGLLSGKYKIINQSFSWVGMNNPTYKKLMTPTTVKKSTVPETNIK
jgi:hypothetical protein